MLKRREWGEKGEGCRKKRMESTGRREGLKSRERKGTLILQNPWELFLGHFADTKIQGWSNLIVWTLSISKFHICGFNQLWVVNIVPYLR